MKKKLKINFKIFCKTVCYEANRFVTELANKGKIKIENNYVELTVDQLLKFFNMYERKYNRNISRTELDQAIFLYALKLIKKSEINKLVYDGIKYDFKKYLIKKIREKELGKNKR